MSGHKTVPKPAVAVEGEERWWFYQQHEKWLSCPRAKDMYTLFFNPHFSPLPHVPPVSCRNQGRRQCLGRPKKAVTRRWGKNGSGKKREVGFRGARGWAGCCPGGGRPSSSSSRGPRAAHPLRTPPSPLLLSCHCLSSEEYWQSAVNNGDLGTFLVLKVIDRITFFVREILGNGYMFILFFWIIERDYRWNVQKFSLQEMFHWASPKLELGGTGHTCGLPCSASMWHLFCIREVFFSGFISSTVM